MLEKPSLLHFLYSLMIKDFKIIVNDLRRISDAFCVQNGILVKMFGKA